MLRHRACLVLARLFTRHLDGCHVNCISARVNMAAEVNVMPFMPFHRIGILDGVGLVAFVGREALAIVAYLAFEVLQFRTCLFRRRRGALTAVDHVSSLCGIHEEPMLLAWGGDKFGSQRRSDRG